MLICEVDSWEDVADEVDHCQFYSDIFSATD